MAECVMELATFVNKILQSRFLAKGRDYPGVDCWGVIYLAYRDVFGIDIPSYTSDYKTGDVKGSRDLSNLILYHKNSCWSWVAGTANGRWQGTASAMDVALFTMSGRPVHVGLMVDSKLCLHAEEEAGVFVEPIDSPMIRSRLEGIYRYAR